MWISKLQAKEVSVRDSSEVNARPLHFANRVLPGGSKPAIGDAIWGRTVPTD
jgi:hypothetical protein